MGTALIIIVIAGVLGLIFGGKEGAITGAGAAFVLLLELAKWGFGILILIWLFSAIFL